jgi:hypothetical protein
MRCLTMVNCRLFHKIRTTFGVIGTVARNVSLRRLHPQEQRSRWRCQVSVRQIQNLRDLLTVVPKGRDVEDER